MRLGEPDRGGQGSRGKAGHPASFPRVALTHAAGHHSFGVTAGRARTISKVRAGHGQRGLRPPHASLRTRERLARPSIHCNAGIAATSPRGGGNLSSPFEPSSPPVFPPDSHRWRREMPRGFNEMIP